MNPMVVVAVLGAMGILLGLSRRAPAQGEPKANPAKANEQTMLPPPVSKEVMTAIAARETKLPSDMPSPIPGVTDEVWRRYVEMWKQADADAATTDGRYGVFLVGRPTLEDQGYMTKSGKGPRAVYRWKPPYSQTAFAINLKLQYDVFVEQAKRHYKAIMARYAKLLHDDPPATIKLAGGTEVPMTLSGLMAVSRQAALGGLDKWINDPASRKGNTTDIFTKFTNLF